MNKPRILCRAKFVGLYESDGWEFVSRKKVPLVEGNDRPDAVVIVGLTGKEGHGDRKLVVINQLRKPVGFHLWELPAGLVDDGETPEATAVREFHEETGMTIKRFTKHTSWHPSFSSPGLTDELACICYADVEGTPSRDNQEEEEDIEIHLLNYRQICDLAYSDEPKDARLALTLDMFSRLGERDGLL